MGKRKRKESDNQEKKKNETEDQVPMRDFEDTLGRYEISGISFVLV